MYPLAWATHWPVIYPIRYGLFAGHVWTGTGQVLQHLWPPRQWTILRVGGGRHPGWASSKAPAAFSGDP